MDSDLIAQLGRELFDALQAREPLTPLSERYPAMTVADAYQVSLRFLSHRLKAGERVVGKKIGVTSQAVQDMLNVRQPDFGFLTDSMQVADASTLSIAARGLIQPRAEAEIAFYLGEDLRGPGLTAQDVLDATAEVGACFEIVDSRIRDWKIRIQDTVADNASCGVYVLGKQRIAPRKLDLAAAAMTMSKNGSVVAQGLGSAVQGHPAQAVAWLANTLGEQGIPFLKGEVILSGSLAPLFPARAGDHFSMDIPGIGSASVTFSE